MDRETPELSYNGHVVAYVTIASSPSAHRPLPFSSQAYLSHQVDRDTWDFSI